MEDKFEELHRLNELAELGGGLDRIKSSMKLENSQQESG